MIAIKFFESSVIILIFLAVSTWSEEISSSTSLPLNASTLCTNSSENSDVCLNVFEIPESIEDDMSNSSNVPYESTYILGASTVAINETDRESINTTTEGTKYDSNNVTAASSNNATVAPTTINVETTTIAADVPSTPFPPGRTVGMDHEAFEPFGDTCSCDMAVGMCEVGCCCDPDCSYRDRLVFTSCHRKRGYTVNPRYCYQTQFLYRNNTEYKTIQFGGGLFCIVEDNLQSVVEYEKKDTLAVISDLNKIESRMNFYSWKKNTIVVPEYVEIKSHKAGEIVWGITNSTLAPFNLPVKVAGGSCHATKSVQYLEDCESKCSQMTPTKESCLSNGAFSAESYYKNRFVFGASKTLNPKSRKMTLQDCFNTSCISVKPFLCPSSGYSYINWEDCEQLVMPSPAYEISQAVCTNVVHSVRYLIRHNGTEGITNVSAYIMLTNVSMRKTPLEQFSQKFSVEFMWASVEKIFPKRSGRPGYIVGKPLISGIKVIHTSKVENDTGKEAIELSYDYNNWLGLPGSNPSGICHDVQRHAVLFGENMQSTCTLSLKKLDFLSTSECVAVQKKILKLFIRDAIDNVTEAKQFNLYVATFGDSAVENTGDWVQVMLDTIPIINNIISSVKPEKSELVCKNLITKIHIDVVFANIGLQENPQAKVLGVAFRFGLPQDISFDCKRLQCSKLSNDSRGNYPITSSVSFVDVTRPAVPHFLEPPVYEVKLPHDFFYPFFSASPIHKINIRLKIFIIIFYLKFFNY